MTLNITKMIHQIWKPIKGYNGFYQVSNTGLVRSLNRTIKFSDGRKRKLKGKMMSPKYKPDGYTYVTLSRNGKHSHHYIHRLVAAAFLPNAGNLPEVNHLSGNKADNSVRNLEWCTHQQNVKHAYDNGLSTNMGGSHSFAVGVIDNKLGMKFETVKEWCKARGIAYSTGRNLLNGSNKSRTIDLSGVVKASQKTI